MQKQFCQQIVLMEEWAARSINGEEIPTDADVKIVKNEGTILFIEKI